MAIRTKKAAGTLQYSTLGASLLLGLALLPASLPLMGDERKKDMELELRIQHPVGRIAAPRMAVAHESVTLSAKANGEPESLDRSYQWELLDAPDGASASLSENERHAMFTAERPGRYRVGLSVSDGVLTSHLVSHEINVVSYLDTYLPHASIGEHRLVAPGESTDIEIQWPFDLKELPGDLRRKLDSVERNWSLLKQPDDSRARLSGRGDQVRLEPDQEGEYILQLALKYEGDVYRFRRSVLATSNPLGAGYMDGNRDLLISDRTSTFVIPTPAKEGHIGHDPKSGRQVARDQLNLFLDPEARLGHLNELLRQYDMGVIGMMAGTSSVLVRFPDPGSMEALGELAAALESSPLVQKASKNDLLNAPGDSSRERPAVDSGDAVPGAINPSLSTQRQRLRSHLAARGHGAWAHSAAYGDSLSDRPWLLIADTFGGGAPEQPHFNGSFTSSDYVTDDYDDHGYLALGIIIGAHDNIVGAGDENHAVGMFPERLRIRAVDDQNYSTAYGTVNAIVDRLEDIDTLDPSAKVVVNTSFSMEPNYEALVSPLAYDYVRGVRGAGMEDRMFHATSAGNLRDDESQSNLDFPSRLTSPYAYATLGSPSIAVDSEPPLDTIAVVEDRRFLNESGGERFLPGCLTSTARYAGNVSAVSGSWTIDDAAGTSASFMGGASAATPQLAGVAAMVWAADKDLAPDAVANRVMASARHDLDDNCSFNPQPVVDAINAVRWVADPFGLASAYRPTGISSDPGELMDEDDLVVLLEGLDRDSSHDYGNHANDFNVDGYSGGGDTSTGTEKLDLSGDGNISTVTQSLVGYMREFDESALTNRDVLCHDAYDDSLYTGSETERNRLLGELCEIVRIQVASPEANECIMHGDPVEMVYFAEVEAPVPFEVTTLADDDVLEGPTGFNGPYFSSVSHSITANHERSRIKVELEDSDSGLFAQDEHTLDIQSGMLDVWIAGGSPRYVRVEMDGGQKVASSTSLASNATLPECSDPDSDRVPVEEIQWQNDSGGPLLDGGGAPQTGQNATVPGEYLQNSGGDYSARSVYVALSFEGQQDGDTVDLIPCAGGMGHDDDLPEELEGYIECPRDVFLGEVMEELKGAFGTPSLSEVQDIIRAALTFDYDWDVTGSDGPRCFPTWCELPPGGKWALDDAFRELIHQGYSRDAVSHLDEMVDVLDTVGNPARARGQLATIMDQARQDPLDWAESEMLLTAYSVAVGALSFGEPGSGMDPLWETLMDGHERQAFFRSEYATRPAHDALDGFISAVADGAYEPRTESEGWLDFVQFGTSVGSLRAYQSFSEDEPPHKGR